jgi:hypothetical protein
MIEIQNKPEPERIVTKEIEYRTKEVPKYIETVKEVEIIKTDVHVERQIIELKKQITNS